MGLPALDLALTKNPIALMINPAKRLEIRKIKLISSKFFMVKPWGVFEIDQTKAIPLADGRNNIYFYDVRNAKPFDMTMLKELEDYGKKNQLSKIKRKDLRQGSLLRGFLAKGHDKHASLEKVRAMEEDSRIKIHDIIEGINTQISEKHDAGPEEGQAPQGEIDVNEYTSVIIDELVSKKLIERFEGFNLKLRMIKGEISLEELLKKLENLKTVEINSPVSMELEKVLDDFHSYEPSVVDAFIDRAEKIGDKIKKMGTPTIKNFMPFMYIFLILIVAIVLGVVFQGLDFSNLKFPISLPGQKPPVPPPQFLLDLFM